MRKALSFLALAACLGVAPARAADPFPAALLARAMGARDAGLRDDIGYDVLRSLTTEVGPRPAGSAAGARAVDWGLATLERLGFANVHAESVTVPHWVRGEARVAITAPWPQPLIACSLGGSVGTPDAGIEAEVVAADSLGDMKLLGEARIRGRIVFFRARMKRTRDGSGYGNAVGVRGRAAAEAAKYGAVGTVIRSIGTDNNRTPHTGAMHYDSTGTRIPELALSNPDADLLERELASGKPVRVKLWSTAHAEAPVLSANVVGEIPGSDPRAGIVLLGGHLDSWDLGTGAQDDGAGVATMIAAARLAGAGGAPRRTIRVVLFANEEFGLSGGRGYAEAHAGELGAHVLAMESDLGAYHVYALATGFAAADSALAMPLLSLLEPFGTTYGGNASGGDADTGPLRERGVPVLELATDASEYFDWHHTANDTFDKVDIRLMRENIAGYAAIARMAADMNGDFGRLPVQSPPAK